MTMTSVPRKIEPLNPVLYGILQHKFGVVRVANPGAPAQIETVMDPVRGRSMKRAISWGEYYTVCCPFCNDVNFKLWVNHTYGASYNEKTGHRTDTHLACCYKHDCLKAPGRYEQFEDLVFGDGRRLIKDMVIRYAAPVVTQLAVEPPGKLAALSTLPDYHPAIEYLVGRGFDPAALEQDFGVAVCVEPKERLRIMRGRLYIPVHFNRQLVGWQGRATDEHKLPKYYNVPGMQKSQMLYNYDTALKQPAVVVVEGVPSVWRIGAAAVCIFGKTLSAWQCNTLATMWAGKPVFYMLDADAAKEIEIGVTHLCQHGANVIPVILPDERDPADYSSEELRTILAEAADAINVTVDVSFIS